MTDVNYSKILSSALYGVDALLVEVETDISNGLPSFTIVGLPDGAIKESKERIRSAIHNTGYMLPPKRITVNLAPAHIKKEGSAYDLPICVSILSALGVIGSESTEGVIILGELSLDGIVKPVKGVLSAAIMTSEMHFNSIIVPRGNGAEASIVEGLKVFEAGHLSEVVSLLRGELPLKSVKTDHDELYKKFSDYDIDFNEVKGQEHAKRALEIAAAGGHNVLMIGPPGSGKTMLAMRVPTILPHMTLKEAIETTKIHSVAGILPPDTAIVTKRPFRSPHHTISDVGLVGGTQQPKPGEVSLSHNGVLFLDELPEFRRNALEALRQPMEDGYVTITRAQQTLTFPSRFMLIAAMNPCPCGYYGDPTHQCTCSISSIMKYRSRISGPLMDRFDIHIDVPAVSLTDIIRDGVQESSKDILYRVEKARLVQHARFKGLKIYANAQMSSRHIKKFCKLDDTSINLLYSAIERLGLSARAYTKLIKVARTIADLDGSIEIKPAHIAEAIQYRSLDRTPMGL
jgi:magnesium chelatase family protein